MFTYDSSVPQRVPSVPIFPWRRPAGGTLLRRALLPTTPPHKLGRHLVEQHTHNGGQLAVLCHRLSTMSTLCLHGKTKDSFKLFYVSMAKQRTVSSCFMSPWQNKGQFQVVLCLHGKTKDRFKLLCLHGKTKNIFKLFYVSMSPWQNKSCFVSMAKQRTDSSCFMSPWQNKGQIQVVLCLHGKTKDIFKLFYVSMAKQRTYSCCFMSPWQNKGQIQVVLSPWQNKGQIQVVLCLHGKTKDSFKLFYVSMAKQRTYSSCFMSPWQNKGQIQVVLCLHGKTNNIFKLFYVSMAKQRTDSSCFMSPWQNKGQIQVVLCLHGKTKDRFKLLCLHGKTKDIFMLFYVSMAKQKLSCYGIKGIYFPGLRVI